MLKEKSGGQDFTYIKHFDKCDFQPMRNHLEQQKVGGGGGGGGGGSCRSGRRGALKWDRGPSVFISLELLQDHDCYS